MLRSNAPMNEVLIELIREQLRWYGHYEGKIVEIENRQRGEARIILARVTIPFLGLIESNTAVWAFPRMGLSQVVPKVNDYAEIYFLDGKPERAVYLYPAANAMNQGFKSLGGGTDTHVLFEPRDDKDNNIKYDQAEGGLTLFEGDEPFVLGNKLKSDMQKLIDALTQLSTDITAWTPPSPPTIDNGAALKALLAAGFQTKVMPTLADILSEVIKGK